MPHIAWFDANCRDCERLSGFLDQVAQRYPDYHARPVAPFGDENACLLIVGLAPGMHGANATGRPFTEDNIGEVMATRGLLSELRQGGEFLGSPPPFARKDRSRFLQQLDEAVCAIQRKQS